MYGSSLRLVTRTPRDARMADSDAAAMPFPSEETTPPVTNTNLVMAGQCRKFVFYRNSAQLPKSLRREPLRHIVVTCTITTASRATWRNLSIGVRGSAHG